MALASRSQPNIGVDIGVVSLESRLIHPEFKLYVYGTQMARIMIRVLSGTGMALLVVRWLCQPAGGAGSKT